LRFTKPALACKFLFFQLQIPAPSLQLYDLNFKNPLKGVKPPSAIAASVWGSRNYALYQGKSYAKYTLNEQAEQIISNLAAPVLSDAAKLHITKT
jgi:hypothetical protein